MASPAPSSDAPPPAADAGAADDTSIAEEHIPTDAGGDSPSAAASPDADDNSSDADEDGEEIETNDENETTTTPNCSALLGWLRTFPVLEDRLASEDDDAASCNFGDREVAA